MRRLTSILVLGLALWLGAAPVWAQGILASKGQRLQNAATSTGNGETFDVSNYAVTTFQTTISATATVTYEGSNDASNFVSLVCYTLDSLTATSSSTATQYVRCDTNGIPVVRARVSSYGSGTVTVYANTTTGELVRDSIVTATVVHGGAPTIGGGVGAGTLSSGSTDMFGAVSTSAGAGGLGEVLFTTAYTSAPRCVVNNRTANGRGRISEASTAGFLFTGFTGSDVFDYICQGGN